MSVDAFKAKHFKRTSIIVLLKYLAH